MISARQNTIQIVHNKPNTNTKLVEDSPRQSDTKETRELILSNSNEKSYSRNRITEDPPTVITTMANGRSFMKMPLMIP
jgi:hypothetical protein